MSKKGPRRTVKQALSHGAVRNVQKLITPGVTNKSLRGRVESLYPYLVPGQIDELILQVRQSMQAANKVRAGKWKAKDLRQVAPTAPGQPHQWRYSVLITNRDPHTLATREQYWIVENSQAMSEAEIAEAAFSQWNTQRMGRVGNTPRGVAKYSEDVGVYLIGVTRKR